MNPAELRRIVGLRLKAARMALGYNERRRGRTQIAFYRSFGIKKGRGNHWECGVAFPNPLFLIELDRRFAVGPDWILCGRVDGLPHWLAEAVASNANGRTEWVRCKQEGVLRDAPLLTNS
jgi:hypothetical protein